MHKRNIGDLGEKAAEKFLKQNGYKIIEKKYFSRYGEIDIIAREGEYLCFIEVRLRSDISYGTPSETITKTKQKRIINTAKKYLMENYLDEYCRFDVVSIVGENKKDKLIIKNMELIKNAF